MSKCTEFEVGDYDEGYPLCRCPHCKGYLPRDFPQGKQFLCRRCGAVLETIPSPIDDPDIEEDTDYEFGGRICLVPDYAVKIDATLPPKPQRQRKRKTLLWAMGVGFSRRVWEDREGRRFIEIGPERIELGDPRILQTAEEEKTIKSKELRRQEE